MNGYIQIQINGQAVGLKFAYNTVKWFLEACIKDKEDNTYFAPGDTGGFTIDGLAKLIECAYRQNCKIKEVEPVLKFEDFYNFVEDAQYSEDGQTVLLKVMEAYTESSVSKKVVELSEKKNLNQLQT